MKKSIGFELLAQCISAAFFLYILPSMCHIYKSIAITLFEPSFVAPPQQKNISRPMRSDHKELRDVSGGCTCLTDYPAITHTCLLDSLYR